MNTIKAAIKCSRNNAHLRPENIGDTYTPDEVRQKVANLENLDMKEIEKLCFYIVRSNLEDRQEMLEQLARFEEFSRDTIPDFIFRPGLLTVAQQKELTQIFAKGIISTINEENLQKEVDDSILKLVDAAKLKCHIGRGEHCAAKDMLNKLSRHYVQELCVKICKEDDVSTLWYIVRYLVKQRRIDKKNIPSFVFDNDLSSAQQLMLTRKFLHNGVKGRITTRDTSKVPEEVLNYLVERKCHHHGTRKGETYYYKNRDLGVNNNWEFYDNENRIVCEDICAYLIDKVNRSYRDDGGVLKTFLKSMSQDDGERIFQGKREKLKSDLKTLRRQPNLPFSFEKFGSLVNSISKTLKDGTSTAFLLDTLDKDNTSFGHSMALYLRKQGGMLTVGVYDPNESGNMKHVDLPINDPKIMQLDLRSFIDQKKLNGYCGKESTTLTICGIDKKLANSKRNYLIQSDFVASIGEALDSGNFSHIHKIAQQCVDEGIDITAAIQKNFKKLNDGLQHAMKNGHSSAIRQFRKFLEQANITDKALLSKLVLPDEYLNYAMAFGHAKVIAEYRKLLELINLEGQQVLTKILAGKNSKDGSFNLEKAIRYGRVDSIYEYDRLLTWAATNKKIHLSGIFSSKHKQKLTEAIEQAREKGNVGILIAYYELLVHVGKNKNAKKIEKIIEKIGGHSILNRAKAIRLLRDGDEPGLSKLLKSLKGKELDLSHHHFNLDEVRLLTDALKKDDNLTRLNLSHCNLDRHDAKFIAEILEKNKTLTKLDLEDNFLGNRGTISIAAALETNTAITELNLRTNDIGENGAKAMADALKDNYFITHLNIWTGNSIRHGTIERCSKYVNQNRRQIATSWIHV